MEFENIQRIAVIGLGRMGHGIAQAFATGGYEVRGFDTHAGSSNTAKERIHSNLNAFVSNGLVDAANVDPIMDRITVCGSETEAAEGAQFVVEAIAEERTAKEEFFNRMEDAVADSTIIASNSSTFTISEVGTSMRRPERAVVTHWFNPPHIVPTVEVVPGPQTTDAVVEATVALHRKIGKQAVRINAELPGFLVNRVQIAMIREVWDLYEKGVASAEDIDAAIQGSLGFRLAVCGPLSVCDFGGVDIWSSVYRRLAPELRRDTELPNAVQKLLDQQEFGTRTGKGLRDYTSEDMDQIVAGRDEGMIRLAKLVREMQSTDTETNGNAS